MAWHERIPTPAQWLWLESLARRHELLAKWAEARVLTADVAEQIQAAAPEFEPQGFLERLGDRQPKAALEALETRIWRWLASPIRSMHRERAKEIARELGRKHHSELQTDGRSFETETPFFSGETSALTRIIRTPAGSTPNALAQSRTLAWEVEWLFCPHHPLSGAAVPLTGADIDAACEILAEWAVTWVGGQIVEHSPRHDSTTPCCRTRWREAPLDAASR